MSKNEQTTFENFFITMFDARTSIATSYLKLPMSNCLTYCIKEIKHCIKNEIDQDIKPDRSKKLISNFYDYILHDNVIKGIDAVLYSKLLLNLKEFSEGDRINLLDKYSFFDSIEKMCLHNYKTKLYNSLLQCLETDTVDNFSYELIDNYINELLANGYNYLYLNFILKQYKNNKFTGLKAFLEYLQYRNSDSFDIYIPLCNLKENEISLIQEQDQKLEKINDNFYCKVYANDVADFYHIINDNLIRINSLFNILRFYLNSNIDYDRNLDIIVESRYFQEKFNIKFSDVDRYVGITPYFKNLDSTIKSLTVLQEKDRSRSTKFAYKLLNALSYAEKDKDIMTVSSYVDNWIAMESLVSLCGRKKGFDAVYYFVPKMLAARIILNDATNTLTCAYKNYHGKKMKLEEFITLICANKYDFTKIKNPFYNLELRKIAKYLSNVKYLQEQFNKVNNLLEQDLLRIYMLRNEYVHTSNLTAFNSMQFIKLKQLLPMCMDEFMRMLNDRILGEESKMGIFFDVYSVFLYRYNARNESFAMLNDNKKYDNGRVSINQTFEDLDITIDKYIFNVIKNNGNLFKVYTN